MIPQALFPDVAILCSRGHALDVFLFFFVFQVSALLSDMVPRDGERFPGTGRVDGGGGALIKPHVGSAGLWSGADCMEQVIWAWGASPSCRTVSAVLLLMVVH